MTRHATQTSTSTLTYPALLPPPMDSTPPRLSRADLAEQLAELFRLEACTASILRAVRQRRELPTSAPIFAAAEAEALHRQRALQRLATECGLPVDAGLAPLSPALASATTSLTAAAFMVVALTLAGYRRLEDLASRGGDLEVLRFAVTAIAEVGGTARQISRQMGKEAGAEADRQRQGRRKERRLHRRAHRRRRAGHLRDR